MNQSHFQGGIGLSPTTSFQIPSGYEDFVTNSADLLKQFKSYEDIETDGDEINYTILFKEFIHSPFLTTSSSSHEIQDTIAKLMNYRSLILKEIEIELNHYIWFYESFQLHPTITTIPTNPNTNKLQNKTKPQQQQRILLALQGITKVGENIEDEWFIVYLLQKISKLFPNIMIQIRDKDGEFLLIEASDYLEEWITPEVSKNRVWLKEGKVHILPNYLLNGRITAEVDLLHAVECLFPLDSSEKNITIANFHIQKIIAQRTMNLYPQRMYALDHYALCILPTWVATALIKDPSLLPIAIHSFTTVESSKLSSTVSKFSIDSLKSSAKSHFVENPNKPEGDGLQLLSIRFSRILYAKCTFKQFKIPKKYHTWMRRMSLANSVKVMKAFDLGCRITAGLEIGLYHEQQLLSKSKLPLESQYEDILKQNQSAVSKVIKLSSFTHSQPVIIHEELFSDLQSYLHPETLILSRVQRILQARDIINHGGGHISDREDTDSVNLFQPLLQALNNVKSRTNHILKVDNEDWLYLKPEDFDREMQQRMNQYAPNVDTQNTAVEKGIKSVSTVEKVIQSEAKIDITKGEKSKNKVDQSTEVENVQHIFEEFKSFLNQKSDYEGIQTNKREEKKKTERNSSSVKEEQGKEEKLTGIDEIDMSAIEALLAGTSISSLEESTTDVSTAAVLGVAQKYLSNEVSTRRVEPAIDSDDEVSRSDEQDDSEDDSEENDSDIDWNEGGESENDPNSDDEDPNENFSMSEYQAAMDAELSQVPAFDKKINIKEFLKQAKVSKEGDEFEDENDDDEEEEEDNTVDDIDEDELNFVMNMLEAQIEGLGAESGPFQQILQQLGLSLGHSIDHSSK